MIIGDGFSSRLFQEIREKRSLAYSVNAMNFDYKNLKTFGVYIGTSVNKYKESLEVTLQILDNIKKEGITERELEKVKNSILSTRATAKENSKIVGRLLNMYKVFGKVFTDKEIADTLLCISVEDVNNKARILLNNFSTCVIGGIDV
ncbi:insulinase family protein [Streptobacillus moniliformis]|nr:insulinase family protein [Streptobacillus moniliformis]